MTEGMPEHIYSRLESDLAALYSASAPEDFALRLGRQLQARAEDLHTARQRQIPWWRRISWNRRTALAFALVILLILASIVAAVGPQRVLAAVQKLLGYVPGIGFVDLEQARQLASPVTVIKGGISFQLDQVIAQPDKTLVKFTVHGMPGLQQDEGQVIFTTFEPTLRLPNGESYQLWASEYSAIGSDRTGKIEFPPIPLEYSRAWLEFTYLPDSTAGGAPEGWQVPFELLPPTSEPPSENFVQSYFPSDASASALGVTLQVLQVARTESEMAVQLRTTWDDPDWQYTPSFTPVLRDDLGHIYRERSEGSLDPNEDTGKPGEVSGESISGFAMLPPATSLTTPGPAPHLDQTYIYSGISALARRWTLSLPELEIEVPADASFQVDLGENPTVDRTLPVDQWLQVAGMDVHILAMRLAKEELPVWAEDVQSDYLEEDYELKFVMEAVPQDHLRMFMLGIDSDTQGVNGGGASGGSHVERLEASLTFSRIPKGKIDVRINEAVVIIEGAWDVSWELPPPGNVPFAASPIYPDVSQMQNGVTLAVKEAVLTDRVTRLELALPGLPQGTELVSTFPSSDVDTIYLEDDSGLRLEPVQEIGTAEIGFNPAELRFAGLPRRPKTLLLHVPEAGILYPGEASLVVEVPQGLQFHQETEQVDENITRQRWVSDPWPLDLPLEIAGYRLHFDQARLERKPRGEMDGMYDYRLELSAEAPTAAEDEVQLSSLRVSHIVRPDGSLQTFDQDAYRRWSRNLPHSTVQPEAPKSRETRLFLSIDATSPVGIDPVPGWYTIDLNGLVVRVLGPWRLRWSMEQ